MQVGPFEDEHFRHAHHLRVNRVHRVEQIESAGVRDDPEERPANGNVLTITFLVVSPISSGD
jgi:hypothetical protein